MPDRKSLSLDDIKGRISVYDIYLMVIMRGTGHARPNFYY